MIKFQTIIKIWLLLLAGVYGFIMVESVSAADVKIPQDCWTQEQCVGQAGNETNKYFFKLGDSAFQTKCGGGTGTSAYGKCYVTPETTTLSVPIPDLTGGPTLTTVTQFPDYLKKIYSFFVIAIAIVAVAYLGFGGYEWIAAAGSAEQIGKAKDTIQGAIMGLLLALGSWVLLNTINSRLVEFDYMRVERIRPSALAHFCVEAEGTQQWIKVGDTSNVKVNATSTECNSEYFSSLNANNTCMGLKCGENSYCLPKTESSDFECVDLDEVDDRCNEQESTRESCDLFDQYVKTLQKVVPNSSISNKVCRLRIDDFSIGILGKSIVDFGSINPNECVLTDIENVNDILGINNINFKRINCTSGGWACKEEDGSLRTIEYWSQNIDVGLILLGSAKTQVEATCTDDERAGEGTDAICIHGNQSICAEGKPTYDELYYEVSGDTDEVYPPHIWVEKPCSDFPPIGGSCQAGEKCWVPIIEYYTPIKTIL